MTYGHASASKSTNGVYMTLCGIIAVRALVYMQVGKENKHTEYYITIGVAHAEI